MAGNGNGILVINAAGAETRVALVEGGTIHEYYLERKREKGIVGNIYKGRVVRVLPGMQAAFVDIGLEKAAFLYVGDVYGDPDFSEEFELTEGEHAAEVPDVPSEQEAEAEEARAQAAASAPEPPALTPVPAVFSFQTTDVQNVPVGTPNTPANLSPGGSQSFVLVFQPTDAFPPTLIEIGFSCDAVNRAQTIVGVSTLLLSASTGAVADVIALAATVGNTGIVDVPGANGAGAFAVATSNVGQASALITVTADTGAKTLPVTLLVCQTEPATSLCLAPPASSVAVTIAPGATPTFSVFALGLGVIDFDPASNRVIVHFTEGSTERGATTVAIQTVQPTP
jgi:ribonuclease G